MPLSRLALASLLVSLLASCAGKSPLPCRLVGASGDWRDGAYTVLVVLENPSAEAIAFDDLSFELTAFDARGTALQSMPQSVKAPDLGPFDQTRFPLKLVDREGSAHHGRVVLFDRRGRVVSEIDVPETRKLQ